MRGSKLSLILIGIRINKIIFIQVIQWFLDKMIELQFTNHPPIKISMSFYSYIYYLDWNQLHVHENYFWSKFTALKFKIDNYEFIDPISYFIWSMC